VYDGRKEGRDARPGPWGRAPEWVTPALAAAAALGLAALGHAAWGSALGAVALYNRVQREGSFDNETRRRIFEEVRSRPGQSIAEIASIVGVSHSTASYHLERLAAFNLLASTQDGNKMRFFVNGGLFTEEERRILSALSNAETRKVLATVLARPGSYRAELTQVLGVSSPTVNWHLARLLAAGLVKEEPRGRNRYLFADARRLKGIFETLSSKVSGTQYDEAGLQELLRLCG
jgi:DNA-binding transcriptional ArsR family regulator